MMEERARRDAVQEKQMRLLTEQMRSLQTWMSSQERATVQGPSGREQPKLSKLTDLEDIEAFLKTFERVMEAYQVDQSLWAFQLAPQLTGKAQLAYTALCGEDAAKYNEVKAAILRRYNINSESYRTRFRGARQKDGESYCEIAVCLQDLLKKWMEGCVMVDEVLEKNPH